MWIITKIRNFFKKKPVEPKTILEAIDYLYSDLDPVEIYNIKQLKSASSVHHTAGRSIRNSWNLWDKKSPIVQDAIITYQIAHADDISGLILTGLFAKVHNRKFDPLEECERFHRHWAKFGTTSLDAGGV